MFIKSKKKKKKNKQYVREDPSSPSDAIHFSTFQTFHSNTDETRFAENTPYRKRIRSIVVQY